MSGTLVILRHGQSEWNLANLFTGWHDVPLTEKGCTSPRRDAPRRFRPASPWPPVERDRRLNERHHGALQGLDKKATTELHGAEQVHAWRRGYDTPPPAVELDSPEHPANDPRDAHLPPEVLPASECLKDVVNRVLPYWYDRIAPQLLDGLNVLVTAHGNSLRALLKHLEGVGDDEIADVNIPTGAPRQYTFDDRLGITSAEYLGDAEAVAAAAAAVAAQAGTAQKPGWSAPPEDRRAFDHDTLCGRRSNGSDASLTSRVHERA